jgi:endonuclease/exonuclease/phosphatase family metal-dependent hydrolase
MRVLTFNLWAMHGDWPARREVIAAEMRRLDPDIAVFQESTVLPGYDQVTDVLGDGYHVAHQQGRTADGVGASMACRWPLTRVRQHFLHVTPRVDPAEPWIGSVALADVEASTPYGRLLLAHFIPSWRFQLAYERELQSTATARLIEDAVTADRPDHVLLIGDFSTEPETSMLQFWCGRRSLEGRSVAYRDAWEAAHGPGGGVTFAAGNPLRAEEKIRHELGRRMDYVFVRMDEWGPTLAVDDCSLILNEPIDGVWASDHYGVTAVLTAR